MKTRMLEQTIFKIGTLLQRGFGELGASIVSESLTHRDIGMDLTRPGTKVELIFSICHIKQFTDTTECLQDEITVFVNKIMIIIHQCAQTWQGRPTKNYGERFLITWRLPGYDNQILARRNSGSLNQDSQDDFEQNDEDGISPEKQDSILEESRDDLDLLGNNQMKNNERASLLKNGEEKLYGGPHDGQELEHDPWMPRLPRKEIFLMRQDIADKALISAIKTQA